MVPLSISTRVVHHICSYRYDVQLVLSQKRRRNQPDQWHCLSNAALAPSSGSDSAGPTVLRRDTISDSVHNSTTGRGSSLGCLPALKRDFNIEGSKDGADSSDQPRRHVPKHHCSDLCLVARIVLESRNIPVRNRRTSSNSVETVISPYLEEKRLNRI